MNGSTEFVVLARGWEHANFVEWITEGLFDLSYPTSESLPFFPIFVIPTHEPLNQIFQAISPKRVPAKIYIRVTAALQDVLTAIGTNKPPQYCDLAWRLAAGWHPAGGIIAQAQNFIALPAVNVDNPLWRDAIRSMLNAVLSYAQTEELSSFLSDIRVSPKWQREFAWTILGYLVKRQKGKWLHFLKYYQDDLLEERANSYRAYKKRLGLLIRSIGAHRLARDILLPDSSLSLMPFFDDLLGGADPIVRILHRELALYVDLGGEIARIPEGPIEEAVIIRLTTQIQTNFRSAYQAEESMGAMLALMDHP